MLFYITINDTKIPTPIEIEYRMKRQKLVAICFEIVELKGKKWKN